jgi:hypothetical protein
MQATSVTFRRPKWWVEGAITDSNFLAAWITTEEDASSEHQNHSKEHRIGHGISIVGRTFRVMHHLFMDQPMGASLPLLLCKCLPQVRRTSYYLVSNGYGFVIYCYKMEIEITIRVLELEYLCRFFCHVNILLEMLLLWCFEVFLFLLIFKNIETHEYARKKTETKKLTKRLNTSTKGEKMKKKEEAKKKKR